MAFTRSFATTTPNIIIVYTSQLCFNYLDFANHKLSVVVVVVCVYTRTPCASRHLFIYFSTQGSWRQATRRSTAPKSVLNSQTQSLQRTCKKLFLRLRRSLFIVCIFKRAHFQPPPPLLLLPHISVSHLRRPNFHGIDLPTFHLPLLRGPPRLVSMCWPHYLTTEWPSPSGWTNKVIIIFDGDSCGICPFIDANDPTTKARK